MHPAASAIRGRPLKHSLTLPLSPGFFFFFTLALWGGPKWVSSTPPPSPGEWGRVLFGGGVLGAQSLKVTILNPEGLEPFA